MSDRTGGPAFPIDAALLRPSTSLGDDIEQRRAARGMSLRDYFAGQALAGIGTWWPNTPPGQMLHEPQDIQRVRAEYAYAQADAMLEARGPMSLADWFNRDRPTAETQEAPWSPARGAFPVVSAGPGGVSYCGVTSSAAPARQHLSWGDVRQLRRSMRNGR